jgi:hypothetical protein
MPDCLASGQSGAEKADAGTLQADNGIREPSLVQEISANYSEMPDSGTLMPAASTVMPMSSYAERVILQIWRTSSFSFTKSTPGCQTIRIEASLVIHTLPTYFAVPHLDTSTSLST